MFEVKNFDNWIEDTESGKFGSGASEKLWLVNPDTFERGVFKFPKVKSDGKITGEYWAEKLATEMKYMREEQTKMDSRISKIEEKPVKRYDSIVTYIITTVIGAIIGAIISLIKIK